MNTSGPAVAGVAVGAAAAYATDVVISRIERFRLPALGGGLVIAALVYPAARRRPRRDGAAAIEWLAVSVTVAVSALAARRPRRQRTAIVAVGWASHAAFDLAHRRGPRSRIPDWYPNLCAAYDIALAALLARRGF